jgi:hypothetical protein
MTKMGVPPAGSGYSAEPDPSCTVSAVPVSIPNADLRPLVLVEWEDSSQPTSAWRFADDIEPYVVVIHSVGWLVHADDRCVSVAANVGGLDGKTAAQCSGVITIPRRCVNRVSDLTENPSG